MGKYEVRREKGRCREKGGRERERGEGKGREVGRKGCGREGMWEGGEERKGYGREGERGSDMGGRGERK